MKKIFLFIFLIVAVLVNETANAYNSGQWWAGFGYYSENALNEVATKEDGSKGLLGEANYPFIAKYDWAMTQSWFLTPQLNYTLLPRDTKGKTAKVTIMQFDFKFGKNTGTGYDWSVGPSLLRETIKGKGGTVVMDNGTGTATFAQPGREVTIQKVLLNLGGGYTSGKFRFGLDLYLVEPFSSDARTQNLMFSVVYNISGSGGGSSGGGGRFL